MRYPLLILVMLAFHARGQQTFSVNFDKSSGLPSAVIYDFIQDSKGFMWFASNNGLTRYDGFEYINYTSQDQTALPGSAIQEDKYGRIWYQNFDGYLYYVKDEQLHSIRQNLPGEYVPFGIVGDYLFVVQRAGVDIFDLKSLKRLRTVRVDTDNVLSSTVLDNSFYFLAENMVFKLGMDLKLERTAYFRQKGIKVNRMNNNGKQLFLVYKNTDDHGLYFLNPDLSFSRQETLPFKGWILTDQFFNNRYWFYTNKGFFVYDQSMKQVMSNQDLKLTAAINKCIIDRDGNYWFSSLRNGVFLITDFNNKVYTLEKHELLHIVQTKKGYLISTQKGEIVETDFEFNLKRKVITLGDGVQIMAFRHDEANDLLFFTTSSGLYAYHNQKEIYFDDIAAKSGLKLDEKYYAVTASGHVMILRNPLRKNSGIKSIWDHLYEKRQDAEHHDMVPLISNLRAKSIDFYGDSSRFIVTTNIGLYVFDPKGVSKLLIDGKPFFANDVFTFNKKIYLLDNIGNLHVVYRSGSTGLLNTEIGIPLNGIRFIKRFGNTLYIVCPNRIFEYDLTYSTSKTYSFNTTMLFITDVIKTGNRLVLLSGNKLITIRLDHDNQQKNIPHFYFNNFYVHNDKVDPDRLTGLRNDQNNIRITYSLLDYGSSQEPQMHYRINKGDWIKLTAGSREIQLASLSPGNYLLEMKMNNFVLKDHIFFNINYPYYQRWWFILSVFAAIVATAVIIYSWRMYLLRNKIRILNEKIILENQLRMSMLTSIKAQMNPHFFYNALNTIQAYIFSNDKFNAITYLAKFSKLTRMIMEMSGEKTIKLSDELASLKLYLELEQMRFQSDFTFEISVAESLHKQTLQLPAMLIQPYVENAVKHGLLHKEGEKSVSVSFLDSEEFLEVVIDDNGIGRKRSEEINRQKPDKPKSFSTESNQKRLDLLNHQKNVVSVQFEDKYNEQGEALGTKVRLFISKN